jgi:large subunit ribosomal protein L13
LMRTYTARPKDIERKWFVIDAAGKPMGRVAAEAAKILHGKNKPMFTPHIDTGDFVIIINADKTALTGRKAQEEVYWHTMYPGGLRSITRGKMLSTKPAFAVRRAVKGMLPHNALGAQMLRKLKVYSGPNHPHEAQQPEPFEIK